MTTTNDYNNAGDLIGISYSGGTASVITAYDRQGRKSGITQGSMTTSFTWDNGEDLLSEAYSGGPLDGFSVTNRYDVLVNRTNLALLNA